MMVMMTATKQMRTKTVTEARLGEEDHDRGVAGRGGVANSQANPLD